MLKKEVLWVIHSEEPLDCAKTVTYLASNDASCVSGTSGISGISGIPMPVDGAALYASIVIPQPKD